MRNELVDAAEQKRHQAFRLRVEVPRPQLQRALQSIPLSGDLSRSRPLALIVTVGIEFAFLPHLCRLAVAIAVSQDVEHVLSRFLLDARSLLNRVEDRIAMAIPIIVDFLIPQQHRLIHVGLVGCAHIMPLEGTIDVV